VSLVNITSGYFEDWFR